MLLDKKKKHGHVHSHISRLYFAVPESLTDLALKEIPNRAGLYIVKKDFYPHLERQCKRNKYCTQWENHERLKLAHLGTMRILGLKKKILELQSKNQIEF